MKTITSAHPPRGRLRGRRWCLMDGMRLPFLRKAVAGDQPLVVSMSGVRLGDSVAFAGLSAALALPLAARTGLSGRCVVVGPAEVTAALETTAIREGLLVEVAEQFPRDRSLELVVIEAVGSWAAAAAHARDAVRSGGRLVVVTGTIREGLLARLRSTPPAVPDEAIVETLSSQGWQRARAIGGRDGLSFVEAFS